MGASTISDFAQLRIQADVLHAWAEGDNANDGGLDRSSNPHPEGELREAWFAGFDCTPLPGVFPEEDGTRVTRTMGRHAAETVSQARRVKALRAQCGFHAWTTGPARHAADLREQVA